MQAGIPLATKPIFDGKVVSLRVDTVRLPNGREVTRKVVDHQPVVVVIPIDSKNNAVLVRQYRCPVGAALLEAPECSSEQLQECAQRELQEEVGHMARSLQDIGRSWRGLGSVESSSTPMLPATWCPADLSPILMRTSSLSAIRCLE